MKPFCFDGEMIKNSTALQSDEAIENGELNEIKSLTQMRSIVDEVKNISSLLQDHVRVCEIEQDWLDLRRVLDQLFFLMFLVMYVATTVVLLYPVCSQHHH